MPPKNASVPANPGPGARAEALASDFLIRNGLVPVARNYRTRHGEIDLIMRERSVLVFIEVRLRTHRTFGGAAASITTAKRERLIAAASAYLSTLPREPACRFDALLFDSLEPVRMTWVRDILEA
jgi:putative endonuclease